MLVDGGDHPHVRYPALKLLRLRSLEQTAEISLPKLLRILELMFEIAAMHLGKLPSRESRLLETLVAL